MKQLLTRILICAAFLLSLSVVSAPAATMSDFSWTPPVIADASEPNVLILLSNDWTGFTQGYVNQPNYDNNKDYWGYFDSNHYYSYNAGGGGYFTPEGVANNHYHPGGNFWSGNFLNWVTMSNADFLRKALTGGRRDVDSITSSRLERGEINSRPWDSKYTGADLGKLVPTGTYDDPTYQFHNSGVTMQVQTASGNKVDNKSTFTVIVESCGNDPGNGIFPDPASCTYYPQTKNYKPQGLLQKYGSKMRFGLMTYSHAVAQQGGVLRGNIHRIDGAEKKNEKEYNWDSNGQEANFEGIIKYVNNYSEKGWDPLAEMFYEAVRYFKGNEGASDAYCGGGNFTADDGHQVLGCEKNKPWEDPILDFCQSNHIIILNDEYPSREHDALPGSTLSPGYSVTEAFAGANANPYTPNVGALTKAVGDWEKITNNSWSVGNVKGGVENPGTGSDDCSAKLVPNLANAYGICPTEPSGDPNPSKTRGALGTFYLAGLAHDVFTSDMRTDFQDDQNITTWAIAYRATSNIKYYEPIPPMNQMWLAAKYGNFKDDDGNGWPDAGEWEDTERFDKNGNPYPLGYFPAETGNELYEALDNVFLSILETTASGTSVSVLSNSGQGEGNLVQAYYRPRISDGSAAVSWLGFLQSLWIDAYGYIREDTNGNLSLDEDEDYVVRYVDNGSDTVARVYPVAFGSEFPDLETDPFTEVPLDQVKTLWEAGATLKNMDPGDRKLFTFVDKNKDGVVDDSGSDPWDSTEEVVRFYDRNYRTVMPYLNVNDVTDGYLGRSQKIRALNLVRWTEGYDSEVNSNRFVDIDNVDARTRTLDGSTVYKLGDIINSTPVSVAAPPDQLHLIYSDITYEAFYKKYAIDNPRETVSYVGANDGMMHAFTSHVYDVNTASFSPPAAAPVGEKVGTELWAYIPQNLLPHLKWLPREDYSHVYYVDMQPRIFDARIFASEFNDSSGKHPYGWGTILVGGFNIGGGNIDVTDFFNDGASNNWELRTFKPSFFAIDVTDPRNPQLLWERTYDDLGMSSTYPGIIRVGPNVSRGEATMKADPGTWYLVLGSGPDAGDRNFTTPQYGGHSDVPGNVYVVDVMTGEPVKAAAGDPDYLFQTAESFAFMAPAATVDYKLNYNDDALYFPITYDANGDTTNHDWRGAVYKLTIPWQGTFSDTSGNGGIEYNEKYNQYGALGAVTGYSSDPLDATDPWLWHKVFDSPRPITAAPALSADGFNNIWVYFGTGRMWDGDDDPNADFGSLDTEYLFGFKDPFFNPQYEPTSSVYKAAAPTYFLNYNLSHTLANGATTVADLETELFNGDPIIVLETGMVYDDSSGTPVLYGYFDEMLNDARTFDGWFRTLPSDASSGKTMKNLNKPAVIGGLSLFSTFLPSGDACSFGGTSNLAILYYETGTAFKRAVVRGDSAFRDLNVDLDGDGTDDREIADGLSLGSGTTSSVGIHIGRQNDRFSGSGDDPEGDMITGFVQQGTGKVVEIDIETAFKVRSGLIAWREN